MDPLLMECEDSGIKVEVKEEPEYIYVDESACRVKLEEKDDEITLPKEESEKIVADIGLYSSQPTSLRILSTRRRGRRHKIHQIRSPESNTIGAIRKILPRPQIQVSNLNVTSAPLAISHCQPTSLGPPKQMPELVPEQQPSGTQSISLKTAPLPQVTTNVASIGRKLLPRSHNPTSIVQVQQAASLQQLHSVNTSTAQQTIPLNQIHSISPTNNCNIMPIRHLQSMPNTNHANNVPQLKAAISGHSQKAIAIAPQKSTVATVVKNPISVPVPQLKLAPGVTSRVISTRVISSSSDSTKKCGQVQQTQLASSCHGRKLLPRPQQQPAIRLPGMVIHPQQQSVSLQHLQKITPVSMHQTVPLQQMQSIPASSPQHPVNVHQMQNVCSVSTQQNISIQQIQSLNTVNAQQNVALHPLQNVPSVTTQSVPLQPLQAIPSISSQHLPVQKFQTMPSGNLHQTMPIQQIRAAPSRNSQVVPVQQVSTIPPGNSQAIPMQQVSTIPPGNSQAIPMQQVSTIPPGNSQAISVQQVSTIPSGNSQAIPMQQVSTIPPENSQAIPMQQVSSIPSGNSQAIPAQPVSTIPSGNSQAIPMQQISTIPSGNSQAIQLHQEPAVSSGIPQQQMPLQHLHSGSSQQSINLQNLQIITTRSSPLTIPVQQVQQVTSGNANQIMPVQQLQAIPSANNYQATPFQQVQSNTTASTEQAMSLQQFHTMIPTSQQQTMPLQQMQIIQSTCPQQGISLQQLQSMTPATQSVFPLQQYSNSNLSVPLQQMQTLPHAGNQQTLPLHQLNSVNPDISQHSLPLQQLQSVPQSKGDQKVSIQQLQSVSHGNTQTNLTLQQMQTSLPSSSSNQAPLQYIQSVTSTASQDLPIHQQVQSINNDSSSNMSNGIEFQSIASSSQDQTTPHLQQQMQPPAPNEVHHVAPGKTSVKIPIKSIRTSTILGKKKLKRLCQNFAPRSINEIRPIKKVGSVTPYAVAHNIKIHKKIFIPRINDKVVPLLPRPAAAPRPGRRILPRPEVPTTSNCNTLAIRLKNVQPATSTTNCKILPKPNLPVLVPGQNCMSIPELESTTASLTHKTILVQRLQSSSHQAAATDINSKDIALTMSESSINADCNSFPSDKISHTEGTTDVTQVSGQLLTSPKQSPPPSPKVETFYDVEVTDTFYEPSLPSETGSPTPDTNREFSPVLDQESMLSNTVGERVALPQEESVATDDCIEDTSHLQLEEDIPRAMSISRQATDPYSAECTQQNYFQSSCISNDPSVDTQEQCDAFQFKSEEYLPSTAEQIKPDITHHSVQTNQSNCFTVSTAGHNKPQEHVLLDSDVSSSVPEEDGNISETESECVLQERHNNSILASTYTAHLGDKHSETPDVEQHLDPPDIASDSVQLIQQDCLISDVSSEFNPSHSGHYYSANYALSSSQPLYSTAANGTESLSTHSQAHSIPCIMDKSQTSSQHGYPFLESSNICVPTQPVSYILYLNTNTPVTYTSAAEVKPYHQVECASNSTTGNTVPSHELKHSATCSTELSYPTQDELSSTRNLSLVQEQCSSLGSADLSVPVSHLQVLSSSDQNNLPFQRITSATYSTTCSYNPAPETGISSDNYWSNASSPKVMEEMNFSHPQNENNEEARNVSMSDQQQDAQVSPDKCKPLRSEVLEEAECEEDLFDSQCLHPGSDPNSLLCLKKYYIQKRRRELVKISKLKAMVISQKNTIQALWKKLSFEKKRNAKLYEELSVSRGIEMGNLDNFEVSKYNNGEEKRQIKSSSKVSVTSSLSNKASYATKIERLRQRTTDSDINFATAHSSTSSCASKGELQCLIHRFMMRDDVSQGNKKNPLRYRRHYLSVLHKRFIADCCKQCSFNVFCSYIPHTVLKCKAEEFDVCVCMTCQNPELKIESMVRRRFLSITTDIEEILLDKKAFDLLIMNLKSLKSRHAFLNYSAWAMTASISSPSVPQKRTATKPLVQVTALLEKELHTLRDHIKYIIQQYEDVYEAKCDAKSSPYHAVIQTDWAPLIILHSVSDSGIPEPQRVISLQCGYMWSMAESTGFVALSDSRERTSAAVCASLNKVLAKLINNGVKAITFIVDPQLHISGVFEFARKHEIKVKFIFLEPGHDSGVAVVVGNSITQLICDTINANGSSVIRTASDVFSLIRSHSSNLVYFYTIEEISQQKELLNLDKISKSSNMLIKPKILVPH
ncbi:mucin-4 isoform X1 [Procambarus clarkii]|uniref:mucin-4 isoform X1 n=1 Tax=Procambarus clarkii TaxID=6728 RepID=UPI00374457ED